MWTISPFTSSALPSTLYSSFIVACVLVLTIALLRLGSATEKRVYHAIRSIALARQLCQQRPGVLQVRRVKPLGEPVVDRRQQVVGFLSLALLLPQPAQAHGGPQLQRFRLLM